MLIEYLKAFLVGGIICAICQLFIDYTKVTPARILVSLVVLGVILGGFGIYQPLVDFAGAGATVPLLSFGNTIAKGTLEAIREDGLIGALSGGLSETAAVVGATIFFALIIALIFKPKAKE